MSRAAVLWLGGGGVLSGPLSAAASASQPVTARSSARAEAWLMQPCNHPTQPSAQHARISAQRNATTTRTATAKHVSQATVIPPVMVSDQ